MDGEFRLHRIENCERSGGAAEVKQATAVGGDVLVVAGSKPEENEHPKPFVWTAKAVGILNKVQRGKQALESQHSHVRRFKQQAQQIFACLSSHLAQPPLDRAGGTIMRRRLIML